MNKENWKPIKGYEGLYEISDHGRVKSMPRIRVVCTHKRIYNYKKATKEIFLKPVLKTTGYSQVTLTKNSLQEIRLLHRLVAETFIPNPLRKPQVNHKDGNRFNNHINNLEWVTASENSLHAYRVLNIVSPTKGKFGKDASRSRVVIQKSLDGNIVKTWECASDAVRQCRFDSGGITKCCQGKRKTHKNYKWEYG